LRVSAGFDRALASGAKLCCEGACLRAGAATPRCTDTGMRPKLLHSSTNGTRSSPAAAADTNAVNSRLSAASIPATTCEAEWASEGLYTIS
jgi:hypothetical protein